MSQNKSKNVFNQVLTDFRSDLENMKKMDNILISKLEDNFPNQETIEWIMDVYIDKLQELDVKMKKIKKEMIDGTSTNFRDVITNLTDYAHKVAFETNHARLNDRIMNLKGYFKSVNSYAEKEFMEIRNRLWESDWQGLEKIKPVEYLTVERKRYVSAFDELQKARDCLDGKIEDVTLHLRPAINQSLLERFKFKRIHPMSRFMEDAKKHNFPLPSYDFIYEIYDEGSDRLHAGKPPTSWEAQQMIKTVSSFIDALDLIEISDEDIEDFKKKSNTVN